VTVPVLFGQEFLQYHFGLPGKAGNLRKFFRRDAGEFLQQRIAPPHGHAYAVDALAHDVLILNLAEHSVSPATAHSASSMASSSRRWASRIGFPFTPRARPV
jgi:hypothetical protein